MPVVASATLEVTPVLAGAQQSLTQQLTGASVEAGDKAGQESGSKFASSMAKKIAVGSAAVAGAVTAVGGALVGTASKTAAYGDSIDKASQKLGVSSTFYQEWEHVLQHSGTSMDKMGTSFKKLATASQDASADQQAAFEKLGLSMEDVKNMSPEELFTNVVSGLQGMEEGTERTAVATDLFGKGAMEMGALLNTSAEDTQAMIDEVHELGGVMGEDAVKASAQYQDSLLDMQTSFEGVKNGIGVKLLPVLSDFMDRVSDFISNTDLSPLTDTIGEAIDALSDFISNLDIEAVGNTFQSVISAVGNAVGLAWGFISSVFSALKDGLSTITDAINTTGTDWGDVWDGIVSVVQGVADIIGQVIGIIAQIIADLIVQAQTQGTFFNAVWQGMQAIIEGFGGVFQGVIDFVTALINGNWKGAWTAAQGIVSTIWQTISKVLQAVWNAIKAVAISVWDAIKTAVTKPINQAKQALSDAWGDIKKTASDLWTSIKETAGQLWEDIKSAVTKPVEDLKTALSDAWTNIQDTASDAWTNIQETASDMWEEVKSAMSEPIEDAKDVIDGIVEEIKGFFPIKIGKWLSDLPKITLNTTTKTILGKTVTIPTGFEWHKKAMEQPYMFTQATIFGAGEAGDEILYGREALLNDIREATGGGGGYTQNITINAPKQLNPSEVARMTKNETRRMVMRMKVT